MYNSTKKRNVIKHLYAMTRFTFLVVVTIMTLAGMSLAREVKSQGLNEVRVNLRFKESRLDQILDDLERQSGFSFTYPQEIGKLGPFTISVKNETLLAALQRLASGNRLSFKPIGKLISVSQLPPSPKPGRIYGKVVDDKGGNLPGASIRIKEINATTMTTVDGTYSIAVVPGTYTVEVGYVSYQSKQIADVLVKSETLTKLDVVLLSSSNALSTVVIKSSYRKESAAGLYAQQKNAASVTDGISAEQIARTPDNNIGQVLKRVSGVSTVNNRYVVVRGMSDRYNQGMIDGVILPSTDMNRHNFAFDVIPAEMVSSVVVNKTATPDVSAEFAGGQVSVNTMDIPLENFTILSVGSGFNSNTLGKNFLQAGKRGKYDFLGFDDGHRKLPDNIRSWTDAVPPDYAVPQSKLFSPDVFNIYKYQGGVNQNYRFSLGRVYSLKNEQKWGFVAGLSLRNNQEISNYESVRQFGMNVHYLQPTSPATSYIDSTRIRKEGDIYKYNTTAGAQFNAGVQGTLYKIGFKNIFSQIMNNTFNTSTGANGETYFNTVPRREQTNLQDPEFIRILQNKLEGEHSLDGQGLKLTWLISRTSVNQQTKDRTKFLYRLTGMEDGAEYYQNPNITSPAVNSPVYDYRIFTDTKETDYNYAFSLSKPFDFLGDQSLVKLGYNGIKKHRVLSATTLNITTEDRGFDPFYNHPYQELLAPENVGTGAGQAYYFAYSGNGTQFDGKSTFNAGYLMLDQRFLKKIRLIYGVRAEKYDLANLQPRISESNTETRRVTGENNTNFLPSVNLIYSLSSKMNVRASFAKTIIRPDFRETSYFGFYDVDLDADIVGGDLTSTRINNTDLRYEWYPSAGEIISVSGFYKSFDKPIELVVDHDATGKVSQYRYQNQKNAVNYGLEMEFRKSFGFIADRQWLRNLSLFGNGTLIRSKVNTLFYEGTIGFNSTPREAEETRALYGQSPYIINAGFSYTSSDYGMTVSYNHAGRRTYSIARNPGVTEYENGRDQLDLQLFARFLKQKMELKLNVGNLLNSTSIFYMNSNGYTTNGVPQSTPEFRYLSFMGSDKYEKAFDDVRYRIKYGINSSLSIAYKF